MLDKLKKMFGGGEDSASQAKYDKLKADYDNAVAELESLNRRYYELKKIIGAATPDVTDHKVPKCVRKTQETCSYFKVPDSACFKWFSKFLRDSGNWTLERDPILRVGHNAESGEPVAWYNNEKFRRVEIPFGSVLVVFDDSPKTGWIVVTDERFEKDWVALS